MNTCVSLVGGTLSHLDAATSLKSADVGNQAWCLVTVIETHGSLRQEDLELKGSLAMSKIQAGLVYL